MLLFFHKRRTEAGPEYLCNTFTRLDQIAYISAVTEADDDLDPFSAIELRCSIGLTVICSHSWPIEPGQRIYTMCFDFERITGVDIMKALPLRAQVLLDGTPVLEKGASRVLNQTYTELGYTKGGMTSGLVQGGR